jgi:hypothetical protein
MCASFVVLQGREGDVVVRPSSPWPAEDDDLFLFGPGPTSSAGRPGPRNGRGRWVFVLIVVLVILSVAVSVWFLQQGSSGTKDEDQAAPPPVRTDYCTAITTERFAELDPEQAGNAAIIVAAATRRALPARAATIALATAFQESRLRNITYGDRDSLGLFQQRPSQGWGTRKQVTNPVYAVNAFYDSLIKVRNYRTIPITKAAQKVQRSGFPEAYAAYAPAAEGISAVLGGHTPAGFTCVLPASAATAQAVGRKGVTGRAAALRAAATRETGARSTRVLTPTTIRFRVPASKGDRRAWALAAWAVARADDLDVVEVRVGGRVWDRANSTNGWTKVVGPRTSGVVVEVG